MNSTAIAAVVRSDLRRRWRTLLLVGLLAGIVAATAISATALARRTTTAYDRLGERTGIDDARGTVLRHPDLVDEIVALPQVTDSWTGGVGVAKVEGQQTFLAVTAGPETPSSLLHHVVLDGRLPGAATGDRMEIALHDDFQRAVGIELGAEIPVRFLTEADYFRFDTGFEGGDVHGAELVLEVVGIVRAAGGSSRGSPAIASPEALRAHADSFIGSSWFVRLADGATVDDLSADVDDLAAGRTLPPEAQEFVVVDVNDTTVADAAADNTAGLLGRALLVLGAVVALAGGLALAQTFARFHAATAADRQVTTALGFTAGERRAATALTVLVPAVIATTVAGVAAVAAARLEPIGALQNYEPSPGPALNLAIVGTGLVVTAAFVLALGTLTGPSARNRSPAPLRESTLVARAARVGGGPEAVMGLRFALEPGRGARAVPVRSAIVGAVVGVAGVVAGLVFVGSLDRLVASPSRAGIPYDAIVSDVDADDLEPLLDDPLVGDVTVAISAPLLLDGRALDGHALTDLEGSLDIDLAAGRLPRTPDEVVLGLRLAADTGKGVGDTMTARDGSGAEHPVAIVGIGVVPPLNGEQLGLNALLTPEGLERAALAESFSEAAVEAAPGADVDALIELLASDFEADADPLPTEVENLRQLGGLPATVAGLVGVIAVVALVNALVVAVRRRRGDLALLRSIGFTRRQSSVSVIIMGLVIAAIGVVVGVPVGLAAGAAVWRVTAEGAFVTTDPMIRWELVLALVVLTAATAVVAAAVPARRAAQHMPAEHLRVE
jgi:putative ABC transport system permease protein